MWRRLVVPLLVVACATLCGVAGAAELFVPVAAQVEGSDGSYWNTELWLTNLSAHEGSFAITFLPARADNARLLAGEARTVALAAGVTVHLQDVVPPGRSGALRIVLSDGVHVTCRLYNARGQASVGQVVPALRHDQMVPEGARAHLAPLLRSSQQRTNVGLFTPSVRPVKVAAAVVNADGEEVGRTTYTLQPGANLQVNDFLLGFQIERAEGHRLVLTGDGPFTAYASIVDARTGAPTYLGAVVE